MNRLDKAGQQARDTQVIAGLDAHFKGASKFTFGGVDYTAKEIQTLLQSRIDAASSTAASKAAWTTAVAAEQEKTTESESVLLALKNFLLTTYGAKSQIVADFGFTPKAKQTTAQTVAAAVVKRAATREARGTKGKKAKLKITGAAAPATAAAPPSPVTANGVAPKAAATS